MFRGYDGCESEPLIEALEEQQAGWMWRLVEQEEQFKDYITRTDRLAAVVGEMTAGRNAFTVRQPLISNIWDTDNVL